MTLNNYKIQVEGKTQQKVYADRDRITQVIYNLLSNAIKHSQNGDRVIISTTNNDNKVIVKVQDFGIGIPKKIQNKIFERYYRASSETTAGLGLGLYISSEIIKRQGGKMWVESEEGKGSNFYFTLPVKKVNRKRLKNP